MPELHLSDRSRSQGRMPSGENKSLYHIMAQSLFLFKAMGQQERGKHWHLQVVKQLLASYINLE